MGRLLPVPITPGLIRRWLPERPRDAHKGDLGHVLVAAGSRGFMGAARLCAAGALRGGAGLVTLAVPESQYVVAASGLWESMILPLPEADGAFQGRAARLLLDFIRAHRITAMALGPGLSLKAGAARFARTVLEEALVPVVADADALNALAGGRAFHRRDPWVMTPHPGEAARLLKTTVAGLQADRPGAARALAERFGAVAVLKGARTLVGGAKALYVNSTGNPGMASGGMGDVLTGLIAALVGQVRGEDPRQKNLRAAVLGAHLHGRAGDLATRETGPVGMLASDLLSSLPRTFKDLF